MTRNDYTSDRTADLMDFDETTGYVRAAIDNVRGLYDLVERAIEFGAEGNRAIFGQLCAYMWERHDEIQEAFPWLVFGVNNVCAALDDIVSDYSE